MLKVSTTTCKSIPGTQERDKPTLVDLGDEPQPRPTPAAPRLERDAHRALTHAPQPLVRRPLLVAPLLVGAAPLVLLQPPARLPRIHYGTPPPLPYAAVVGGGGQRRRRRPAARREDETVEHRVDGVHLDPRTHDTISQLRIEKAISEKAISEWGPRARARGEQVQQV